MGWILKTTRMCYLVIAAFMWFVLKGDFSRPSISYGGWMV